MLIGFGVSSCFVSCFGCFFFLGGCFLRRPPVAFAVSFGYASCALASSSFSSIIFTKVDASSRDTGRSHRTKPLVGYPQVDSSSYCISCKAKGVGRSALFAYRINLEPCQVWLRV
ncbi:hypothetical protein B0J14DRAFT_599734 [Halenospora varia]|nr:hypothetical protein B0J14DRAFT_599734 [Halenospora varia]